MLITDLSQAPGLEVVQRERLDDVIREQSLQAVGRVEEKSMVRIGRLTGATVILLGSATRVGDILRLDAHLWTSSGVLFSAPRRSTAGWMRSWL